MRKPNGVLRGYPSLTISNVIKKRIAIMIDIGLSEKEINHNIKSYKEHMKEVWKIKKPVNTAIS